MEKYSDPKQAKSIGSTGAFYLIIFNLYAARFPHIVKNKAVQ
jgi:hypothetical protein